MFGLLRNVWTVFTHPGETERVYARDILLLQLRWLFLDAATAKIAARPHRATVPRTWGRVPSAQYDHNDYYSYGMEKNEDFVKIV